VRAAAHERDPLALEVWQRVDASLRMPEHHSPVADQALLAELEALGAFVIVGKAYKQIDLAFFQACNEIVKGIGDVGDLPVFLFRHPADHVDCDPFGWCTGRCADNRRILEHPDPDGNALRPSPRQRKRHQPEQPCLQKKSEHHAID